MTNDVEYNGRISEIYNILQDGIWSPNPVGRNKREVRVEW